MTESGREPGELIGRGRAADVYALDAGRVLRRYRIPYPCTAEAELMRYLRQAGYPVPEVFDTDGLPSWIRPAVAGLRRVLLSRFRTAVRDDPGPHLAQVAAHRLTDVNVRPAEAGRIRRLARAAAR